MLQAASGGGRGGRGQGEWSHAASGSESRGRRTGRNRDEAPALVREGLAIAATQPEAWRPSLFECHSRRRAQQADAPGKSLEPGRAGKVFEDPSQARVIAAAQDVDKKYPAHQLRPAVVLWTWTRIPSGTCFRRRLGCARRRKLSLRRQRDDRRTHGRCRRQHAMVRGQREA